MDDLPVDQSKYSLFPAFGGRSMGLGIISQPGLPNGGHGNAQGVRQIFMTDSREERVGSFFEIHVCSLVDKCRFVN